MKIAVIIIHHYTPQLLINAIASLRKNFISSNLQGEIIVVDNGSNDQDKPMIVKLADKYIDPQKNLGYAGGINLGITQTNADILFVMNPDVEVLPYSLLELVNTIKQGASAVGPKFYWDKNKKFILPPTEIYNRRAELIRILATQGEKWAYYARQIWRKNTRKHWQTKKKIASFQLSGALLGFTRKALDTVGLFDSEFQLYFEETDWLMRLKKKGLKSYYVPSAEVVHLYNQSACQNPNSGNWFAESALRFQKLYYGERFLNLTKLINFGSLPPLNSLDVLVGKPFLDWKTFDKPIKSSISIEISYPSLGFPAATTIISSEDSHSNWVFPSDIWDFLAEGIYHLQIVDHNLREIKCYLFEKQKS